MARSSLRLRPPGVYQEQRERRYTPLTLSRGGIPAFLGAARKGPLHVPIRINSFEHFKEVFGELDAGSYLAPAVEGFFVNGGEECFVLRVAHISNAEDSDIAQRSSMEVRSSTGEKTLLIEASSEGTWGDSLSVCVRPVKPTVTTVLTLDLHPGDAAMAVKSTHGFSRGTLIRIFDDTKSMYRVVQEVEGRFISFADKTSDQDFASAAPTYVEPVEFEIEARGDGRKEVFDQLTFARQSLSYVERAINGHSRLISVTDLGAGGEMSDRIPVDTGSVQLSGGRDGLYSLTPEDFIGRTVGLGVRYGLQAIEALDGIDLIVAPDLPWCLENTTGFPTETHMEAVQQEIAAQCERLRDRFAIFDTPKGYTHREALAWRQMFDSAYGAFYFPWVEVEHAGMIRLVPPSGHIAGVYARVDEGQGTHHAAANAVIEGVVDVEMVLLEEDIGDLNGKGINCIKYFPTRGIRIWGARTTSSDTSLRFVNVRRVLSAIIRSMSTNLQWVVFEPNSARLWKTVEQEVTFFLHGLWERGFFTGRAPEEAFYVKCDYETNPPEIRESGRMVVEVGVAPVRPAEYLIFRVEQEVEEVGPGAGLEDTSE